MLEGARRVFYLLCLWFSGFVMAQWLAALSHMLQTSSRQLPQFLFPSHLLPFIFHIFLFDYK